MNSQNNAADLAADTVDRLRATFRSGRTHPLAWRRDQLLGLRALLTEHREDVADALFADLRRPRPDAYSGEVDLPVHEIDHTLAHLEEWLRPKSVQPEALASLPEGTSAATQYDPLGVVLVIAPWNYPVQLLLVPVIGALAAGNAVLLKPSELAPATSALIARLVPQYLDTDAVAVIEGAVPETTALLAQQFDHIFYTGSGNVGKIVMKAAAEHLTPVTLELGGKSPVFVDRDVDLAIVAQRLVAAKFLNAGQVCVTPDYVLTDPATAPDLEAALAEAVRARFGADPQKSALLGRLVTSHHFDRVAALLASGRVVIGGETDRDDLYIAPTVLADVKADEPVMAEEIFGPVLPVVTIDGLDEAITFINDRDKPLSLYCFTNNEDTRKRLAAETSSGAIGFGLPIAHLRIPELPFGGVGGSGIGQYHGEYSIATFSKLKARLDVPVA